MKNRLLITFAGLLLGVSAHARVDNLIFQGVDVSPVLNYFAEQVKTLNREVTTYNWSSNGNDPFWEKEYSDEESANILRNGGTRSFWANYGDEKGSDNMYGYGLYTAVDPVATRSYGSSTWRVAQIKFPVGTKMIDLATFDDVNASVHAKSAEKILKDVFQCPSLRADDYFREGGKSLTPKCRELSKFIFDEQLKIQFFAYPYNQSKFNACADAGLTMPRAFVLTRGEWIQPGLVRYFTAKTKGYVEDRTMIQTLFFDVIAENGGQPNSKQAALEALKQIILSNPTYAVRASKSDCSDDFCTITARLCTDNGECMDSKLPPIARSGGGLITAKALAAKNFEGYNAESNKLLWADLEGKPKAKTSSAWIKKNSFTCAGELPYDSAEKDK